MNLCGTAGQPELCIPRCIVKCLCNVTMYTLLYGEMIWKELREIEVSIGKQCHDIFSYFLRFS